jgi:hypothetical protein
MQMPAAVRRLAQAARGLGFEDLVNDFTLPIIAVPLLPPGLWLMGKVPLSEVPAVYLAAAQGLGLWFAINLAVALVAVGLMAIGSKKRTA